MMLQGILCLAQIYSVYSLVQNCCLETWGVLIILYRIVGAQNYTFLWYFRQPYLQHALRCLPMLPKALRMLLCKLLEIHSNWTLVIVIPHLTPFRVTYLDIASLSAARTD